MGRSNKVYQCPSDQRTEQAINSRAVGYTDYWFNARLSGLNQKRLASSSLTILNGDGNDGTDLTDTRYSISHLSSAWRDDKTSPLYRHLEGANYGFTDGHVKWYQPTRIQNNASVERGLPTFNWK